MFFVELQDHGAFVAKDHMSSPASQPQTSSQHRVAILGASDKPQRYAYKALQALIQHGHEVYPINPKLKSIDEHRCFASLVDCPAKLDTITLYLSPAICRSVLPDIIANAPKRVIFNPGTENDEIMEALAREGIDVEEACTLVLLATHQFT